MTDFLTDDERRVIDLLAEAAELFGEIVGDGETREADLAEIAAHIHALQNAVLAQAAARLYPNDYRLMGDVV